MRNVPFVTQEEAELARRIEEKLLSLPASSGILFVGVKVHPGEPDLKLETEYRIFVGCSKEFDERLYDTLISVTFKEEIAQGKRIGVIAQRGRAMPQEAPNPFLVNPLLNILDDYIPKKS